MKPKKILTYALVAFLIWWVIQQPSNAAHVVHNLGSFLSSAATGFSNFVGKL